MRREDAIKLAAKLNPDFIHTKEYTKYNQTKTIQDKTVSIKKSPVKESIKSTGKSNKEQFKTQPYIDPKTQTMIKVGGTEYKQLEKKYGEPYKVKSPKSKTLITVGGVAYKNLIKDGYNDQQIFEHEMITKEKKIVKSTSKKVQLNTNAPTTTIPINETKNILQLNLPDDVLINTLLYSDLNTIVNVCTSNKHNIKLCDDQFWVEKFKVDHLPLTVNKKSFKDWTEYYAKVLDAKKQAEMMVKIILTFNKYKGDSSIFLWYNEGKLIKQNILDYIGILPKMYLKQTTAIVFKYDRKSKLWSINIDQMTDNNSITYNNVINILTLEFIRYSIDGDDIKFNDYDTNELLYDNLLRKAIQNKPIPRAYLAMYQLLGM